MKLEITKNRLRSGYKNLETTQLERGSSFFQKKAGRLLRVGMTLLGSFGNNANTFKCVRYQKNEILKVETPDRRPLKVKGDSVSRSVQSNSSWPMDGSSVHGILQSRILEWVASPVSRGSSDPRIRSGSPVLQSRSELMLAWPTQSIISIAPK